MHAHKQPCIVAVTHTNLIDIPNKNNCQDLSGSGKVSQDVAGLPIAGSVLHNHTCDPTWSNMIIAQYNHASSCQTSTLRTHAGSVMVTHDPFMAYPVWSSTDHDWGCTHASCRICDVHPCSFHGLSCLIFHRSWLRVHSCFMQDLWCTPMILSWVILSNPPQIMGEGALKMHAGTGMITHVPFTYGN